MESQLKQRITEDPTTENTSRSSSSSRTTDPKSNENMNKTRQDNKRRAMAKRGLKSLSLMLAVPLLLTLVSTCVNHSYVKSAKPSSSWLPPFWAIQLTSLANSLLMGLSAWLVWAEGGFHKKPKGFQLFAAWILLNVVWHPIVFGYGATRVGLVFGLGMVGAVFGCSKIFKEVNPVAGDLVKACLVFSGLLTLVNLKLVFV